MLYSWWKTIKNDLCGWSWSSTLQKILLMKVPDVDTVVSCVNSTEVNERNMSADSKSDITNYGK